MMACCGRAAPPGLVVIFQILHENSAMHPTVRPDRPRDFRRSCAFHPSRSPIGLPSTRTIDTYQDAEGPLAEFQEFQKHLLAQGRLLLQGLQGGPRPGGPAAPGPEA